MTCIYNKDCFPRTAIASNTAGSDDLNKDLLTLIERRGFKHAGEPDPFEGKGMPMRLDKHPCSGAIGRALDALVTATTPPKARKTQGKREALGALVGDLLAIRSSGPDAYGYRPVGSDSFAGRRIGRRPFKAARDQLRDAGYLSVRTGDAMPKVKGFRGTATTMQATEPLLDMLASFGITPSTVADHFAVAETVVLRAASKKSKGEYGDRIPGRRMRVDRQHPTVIASERLMTEINAALAKAVFYLPKSDSKPPKLERVFNNGDKTGKDYNEGGRAYSPYQNLSQAERKAITINGEAVCEVDISSSYYSIALTKLGYTFDASKDYYRIPRFPRHIVKAYVNSCLGQGKPIRGWPKDLKDDYRADGTDEKPNRIKEGIIADGYLYTGNLEDDFPIATLKRYVLPLFPALREISAKGLNWGPLSYTESCAVIGAVHELCTKHGVPCLPVHDSIICQRSKADLVEEVLSRHFGRHVGTRPKLSRK